MSTPRHSPRRMSGIGRVLVIVYGIMALAATGRSFVQIGRAFDEAPVAYALSADAAAVYIVATLALVCAGSPGWYHVAWITIGFEFAGALVIGTLSLVVPELFQHSTVWSLFGIGYVFVPLVLPIVGMWWLAKHPPARPAVTTSDAAAGAVVP